MGDQRVLVLGFLLTLFFCFMCLIPTRPAYQSPCRMQ